MDNCSNGFWFWHQMFSLFGIANCVFLIVNIGILFYLIKCNKQD
jgi:hypothetical protein